VRQPSEQGAIHPFACEDERHDQIEDGDTAVHFAAGQSEDRYVSPVGDPEHRTGIDRCTTHGEPRTEGSKGPQERVIRIEHDRSSGENQFDSLLDPLRDLLSDTLRLVSIDSPRLNQAGPVASQLLVQGTHRDIESCRSYALTSQKGDAPESEGHDANNGLTSESTERTSEPCFRHEVRRCFHDRDRLARFSDATIENRCDERVTGSDQPLEALLVDTHHTEGRRTDVDLSLMRRVELGAITSHGFGDARRRRVLLDFARLGDSDRHPETRPITDLTEQLVQRETASELFPAIPLQHDIAPQDRTGWNRICPNDIPGSLHEKPPFPSSLSEPVSCINRYTQRSTGSTPVHGACQGVRVMTLSFGHRRPLLSPSILNADFARLGTIVQELEQAGADAVHLDVMDGRFVPNISFGIPVVSAVRRSTTLPLDVHLMIVEPERYIAAFAEAGATALTVHVEATVHLHRTITAIKELGLLAGVALNPATPLAAIEEILPFIDLILIMTVNPGFGGQTLIPAVLKKVERLRQTIDAAGLSCLVSVDGGIKLSNVEAVLRAGADIIVTGSALFDDERSPGSVLRMFRQLLDATVTRGTSTPER